MKKLLLMCILPLVLCLSVFGQNEKISQLPAGAPAQGADIFPIARSGANYSLSLTNIWSVDPFNFVAGGDLGGSATSQEVTGVLSHALPGLSTGYLNWTGSAWAFTTPSGSFTPGLDLSGSSSAQEVIGIQSHALPSLATGYLNWNGAAWAYSTPSGTLPSASSLGQGVSANGAGTVYTAGFDKPIPAYLYSGADICAQAVAAATANPYSDISAVLSLGSNPCSVDPTGAFSATPITVNPPFRGRIFFSCVGSVGSKCTLNPQTPWIEANTSTIDFGGVNVTIASQFYAISGTRCWTAGSGGTSGTDNFCGNANITTLSITPQSGGNASCAAVTIPWTNNTAGTTAELRGGEFVDNSNFTAPANNGKFRVMPASDNDCPGNPGPSTNSGAGTETFWIWAPDAVSCANPSACGSSATVAGPTALWYQGPRAFDLLGGSSGGQECVALSGTPNGNNCGIFGAKLLNVGEVHAFGYGMLGYDNSACEEQCLIDNSGSHAIYRISSAIYHIWTNVPQNNDSFKHGEDYCNQSKGPCVNDGTAKYGAFHVGMLLWDTWSHGTLEDFTINENTQCGIDVEATGGIAVGYNAVNAIQGIHFQSGSNLGNICVGMQAGASGVNIRQVDSNASNPPLANILLGGSSRPPLGALNDWNNAQTYSYATVILPTVNNVSNYVLFTTISGTSGGSEPNWSGGGCSAYSPGGTCSDGSVTWTIVGTNFPNSLGVGTSGINVSTISNQPGAATIFNGASDLSWTCNEVAFYVYATSGYEVSDCGTHPPNFANGLKIGSISGATQCLQANSSGVVSGTGTSCGGGFSVNGAGAGTNLSNTTPAAAAGSQNVTFQISSANVSAEMPLPVFLGALDPIGSGGSTQTINCNNGAVQTITLSTNLTVSFTQPSGTSCLVRLVITQAVGGNDTVTWTSVKWPGGIVPAMTTAASAVDVYSCLLDGSTTKCTAGQNFQ